MSFPFLHCIFRSTEMYKFNEVQCFTSFGTVFMNSLPKPRWWRFSSMLSSRSFIVLAFISRSMIYFDLSLSFWLDFLIMCVTSGSNLKKFFLHMNIPWSHHLLKDYTTLAHWIAWYLCWKSTEYKPEEFTCRLDSLPLVHVPFLMPVSPSWFLWLHKKFGKWVAQFRSFSFFAKLFWLFWALCTSPYTFGSAC